ncbi:tetratricopeptide repeat protein [Desulfonema magnum]|uniref:Tetratricopeptide repeat-containing n=1 Tax=Desulfonema magnum TaxID=45655 RepID=A0A975BX73_9BACT|nr:hypothetical protein [Desulfonema magnum]QTA92799.1 tetratricopeptide repeat-containing [Desulfonema magnum]
MKYTILILIIIAAVTFSGCSGNNAKELYDTAKLEELQNNPEHARQLYQELIKKHPKSEYAKIAKNRLSALQKSN